MTPTIAPNKRVFEIDALRGIAVLLVMGFHTPELPMFSRIGYTGVDLFFVLSGFLISNLLFQEYRSRSTIRLARFFMRRAMKIYPSFYLLIGLTVVYCLIWDFPLNQRKLLGELFLVQNYVGSMWGHTWSLAVEEHFYIFLPLLLALMLRFHKKSGNPFEKIPYVFLGVAVICLALRVFALHYHFDGGQATAIQPNGPDWRLEQVPDRGWFSYLIFGTGDPYTGLRFDSLFCGVLLGYLHNFRPQILTKLMSDPWRFPVSLAGILCLAPITFFPIGSPFIRTIGFTLLYLGFGTMLMISIYKDPRRKNSRPGKLARGIAWVGLYSYTVYLWHFPLILVFLSVAERYPTINPFLVHLLYIPASILAGVLSAKLVEIPVLKLRERMDRLGTQRTLAPAA
jgi:peptidoglycan/LPS O-acetylase OafA/YrhL